jgi:hypothetical protein
MAPFDRETLDRWRALAILDQDGDPVGSVGEFYLDRETGHPTWALVETGLFGATLLFVPLVHATERSNGLQVPYSRDHLRDVPRIDPHDELTPIEEATLSAHFGIAYTPSTPASPQAEAPGSDEPPGPVAAAPGAVAASETVEPEPGSVAAPWRSPGAPEDPGPSEAAEGAPPFEAPDEVPGEPGSAAATAVHPAARWAADSRDLDRVGPAAEPSADAETTESDPSRAASAEEAPGAPPEPAWASGAARSFEEPDPSDRPTGASDRWREAKLAAERERIARAAAAQPEPRSALSRARRRLSRLVGGGQDPAEPETETDAPIDHDAAAPARRERLDRDDDHRRR